MARSSAEPTRARVGRGETRQRVARLRAFAEGADFVPILIHADPDPDAIAAAMGVRALLRRTSSQSPILCTSETTRPQNRRMVELLGVRVTTVSPEELDLHERLIVVDTQPAVQGECRRLAVIDHHPRENGYAAEFEDIRPDVGSTSTILTEYLRADEARRIRPPLATALLHGIKTDTATLSRGVTASDVRAYAFLQRCADLDLLRRIARPAYAPDAVRAFGRALAGMAVAGDVVAGWAGNLDGDDAHILADLADFCMEMRDVAWVAAAALVAGDVIVNVRHLGESPGAGDVARALTRDSGTGGGHATMARMILPGDWLGGVESTGREAELLLERLVAAIEAGRRD